jgi:hypothetical protein
MFFLWFRICAHLRHLWLTPAPLLGFLRTWLGFNGSGLGVVIRSSSHSVSTRLRNSSTASVTGAWLKVGNASSGWRTKLFI